MRNSVSLPLEGPTTNDLARLWKTIQKDFIPGIRVEVRVVELVGDKHGLVLELVDDSVMAANGEQWVNVWSAKTFANPLHLISQSQLYDLLIVGYRTMERYFEHGEAFAPSRRPR